MKAFIFITLFFISLHAVGQQFFLKGQVKDEKGKDLPAVKLKIQSSGQIFQSGAGGYFGITLLRESDTIQFFLPGYIEKTIAVSAKQYYNVSLAVNKEELQKARRKLLSRTPNYKVTYDDIYQTGNETYSSLFENRFLSAQKYPSTQVGLYYNRASYSNMRRFLTTGVSVPQDAVRIEEMLNYFDWDYKEPDGNEAFTMESAITTSPWNKKANLLFLKIHSRKLNLEALPPSHLVFLIDVSGSMDLPNRLPLLKSGFRFLVQNLRQKDTVSLVAYGGKASILLDAVSGIEKARITNVIDSLHPGGTTAGEYGIKEAYRLARKHFIKGGNNRVILATDGDFNVGIRSEKDLEQLIEREKHSGIYLTCLGVGMGDYKDSKIQILAQKGNGNFAYLDSYAEAEKVLFKEFFQTVYTVADDAFLQMKFDTSLVEQYRLVGYDNKVSAIRDTTALVQGGEIGSGSTLLMAFEITLKQNAVINAKLAAEATISYISKQSLSTEEFKYEIPNSFIEFSLLPEDYSFASAVIMFGLKLKKSVYAKSIKWDLIFNTANQSFTKKSFTRQEFLQLVEIAQKGIKKKKFLLIFNVKEE